MDHPKSLPLSLWPSGRRRELAEKQAVEWRREGFLTYAEAYQLTGLSSVTLGRLVARADCEGRRGIGASWIRLDQLATALRDGQWVDEAEALLAAAPTLREGPLPKEARTRAQGRPRGAKTRRPAPQPLPGPPADPEASRKLRETLAALTSAQDLAPEPVETEEITYPVSFALRDRLFPR